MRDDSSTCVPGCGSLDRGSSSRRLSLPSQPHLIERQRYRTSGTNRLSRRSMKWRRTR